MALLKRRPVRITQFVGQYILPENQMINDKIVDDFCRPFYAKVILILHHNTSASSQEYSLELRWGVEGGQHNKISRINKTNEPQVRI